MDKKISHTMMDTGINVQTYGHTHTYTKKLKMTDKERETYKLRNTYTGEATGEGRIQASRF